MYWILDYTSQKSQKSIPIVLSQTKTPENVNIRKSNKGLEMITLDRIFNFAVYDLLILRFYYVNKKLTLIIITAE